MGLRRELLIVPLGMIACTMANPAFDVPIASDADTRGDGDGDPSGDGDGDPTGDGDGDPTGDGDGDPTGDGDGDGDGDPDPQCAAPAEYIDCDIVGQGITQDPFAAIGLGCPSGSEQGIEITNQSMSAADPSSWRVAKYFGLATGPNHGGMLWAAREFQVVPSGDPDIPAIQPNTSAAILLLSTGVLPSVNFDGGVIVPFDAQVGYGENLNPNGGAFPAPISPTHGSNFGQGGTPFINCDGANDCSDSLHHQWYELGWNSLNDKLALQFTMTTPAGVHGYIFDFAFFSSEYPTFIDTMYNDMFVAWSDSETYTGNLTFIGAAPMNTTSLAEAGGFEYVELDPALDATGFELNAGTGWLLARGPATPGEKVQVTLSVSDLGDALFGSVVLIDNFRWDCVGCEGDTCGFTP
ncbi:MAG TPA: choice-of-anchor L domain-containing protein [Enhygromyxa sp.]|nr:choice-of-anchor L domain-containing protein [Enhygromyxa sp.]